MTPETVYAAAPQKDETPTTTTVSNAALCNCYAYVRSQIPSFPPTWLLKNNTSPHVGAVAIFNYSGVPHYGIITEITADGFWLKDSNFGGCGLRTHFIEWTNHYITGFWGT